MKKATAKQKSLTQPRSILPVRDDDGKTGEQFRAAALKRFAEANTLWRNRHWLGALYLGGYVVETMLKWALNDAIGQTHVPRHYGGREWHNLRWILENSNFHSALQKNAAALKCWSTVKDWDSNWRYESEVPVDFRSRAERRVADWLKCVEFLMHWLNSRTSTVNYDH